ncbi:MAG: ROK family protein [archaeon]
MSYVIGIDLGAGFGAKMAISPAGSTEIIAREELPLIDIGTVEALADGLSDRYDQLVGIAGDSTRVSGIGLATPGVFSSDGTYITAANLGYLNGRNLRMSLEERTQVPTALVNDADSGGLAEWNVARQELLYWAFGGGWGGAWLSAEGEIMHPSVDWDGEDSSLHLTNEPGYATAVHKDELRELFRETGVDYDLFERLYCEADLVGPSGDNNTLRAEKIVSNKGMHMIMRAVVGDDGRYAHITRDNLQELTQMAENGDAAALFVNIAFGAVVGLAGNYVLKCAAEDGAPADIPIYVGGGVGRALTYFGDSAEQVLNSYGYQSRLMPSQIKEGANLMGALVAADRL